MKVLIIGSSGFIGSNLLRFFREDGYETWGCDLNTDYVDKKYFQVDAALPDFEKIFRQEQFGLCINCSGAASVPDSLITPLRDFILNTANVARLLDAIRLFSPECKLIQLSSAAVYGNPVSIPVNENSMLTPLSPYGYHKLMAENILAEYVQFFGLKVSIIRIFSAYGRGLRKQLLWDICQKSSKSKDQIELFGTGKETRDFIHVKDLFQAIFLLSLKGRFNGDTYNLGSGLEVAVNDLASLLLSECGWRGEIKFSGVTRKGDPMRWCANIEKMKELGFVPSVSLSDGVKDYVSWFNGLGK